MDEVVNYACISKGQLERISNTQLRMSPKLFALKQFAAQASWIKIDYYNQTQLIHDFKTFSCSAPIIVEQKLDHPITAVKTLQRCLFTD